MASKTNDLSHVEHAYHDSPSMKGCLTTNNTKHHHVIVVRFRAEVGGSLLLHIRVLYVNLWHVLPEVPSRSVADLLGRASKGKNSGTSGSPSHLHVLLRIGSCDSMEITHPVMRESATSSKWFSQGCLAGTVAGSSMKINQMTAIIS